VSIDCKMIWCKSSRKQVTAHYHARSTLVLLKLGSIMSGKTCTYLKCYDSFPGRPDKAGAKMENNCRRASLDREHVGSLSPDQWVKDKQVKRCIRLEVCKLTRRARRTPLKVAS
jgi:hypothetical protein